MLAFVSDFGNKNWHRHFTAAGPRPHLLLRLVIWLAFVAALAWACLLVSGITVPWLAGLLAPQDGAVPP